MCAPCSPTQFLKVWGLTPANRHTMTRFQYVTSSVVCLLLAATAHAQSAASRHSAGAAVVRSEAPTSSNILRELDSSIEKVVTKVSPAVVQIVVAGYGPAENHRHIDTATIV